LTGSIQDELEKTRKQQVKHAQMHLCLTPHFRDAFDVGDQGVMGKLVTTANWPEIQRK